MRNINIFYCNFICLFNSICFMPFLLVSVWFSIVAPATVRHYKSAKSWHFTSLKAIRSEHITRQIVNGTHLFFSTLSVHHHSSFPDNPLLGIFSLRCVTKRLFFFWNSFIFGIHTHVNEDFSAHEPFNQLMSYPANNICDQHMS